MQNTKIRAAAFTCCLLFPKKRARTFPGGLAQTPSVISRCLRATRLSATVIYFFYFFSIFCAQYISVSLPTTYIHSLQHIQFGFACCQNATLSSFFVRSILILSQVVTPSSGASRPSSHQHHSYPTKAISPTSGFAGQYHTTSTKPITHFPQTPSAISRCLRATSFPLHFAAAFHSSNIPFFLFSFFHPFSFSLFFLSFFFPLFLFFFSLLFLVYTFFFSPFSICFFAFFISFSFLFFLSHHPARFLCAPAQRM